METTPIWTFPAFFLSTACLMERDMKKISIVRKHCTSMDCALTLQLQPLILWRTVSLWPVGSNYNPLLKIHRLYLDTGQILTLCASPPTYRTDSSFSYIILKNKSVFSNFMRGKGNFVFFALDSLPISAHTKNNDALIVCIYQTLTKISSSC